MKVSGFSFVRNGVSLDYPFIESIQSILPLCDEFIIAVGNSDDDTLARIEALQSPKIRIVPTVWDESLRTGGQILARQTNIALDQATGDWAVYLQADEIVHELDLPEIRDTMARWIEDSRVEGLLFSYKHFYGSYRFVGASRRWYRNEVRIVRTGIGVRSWGDAQGFRRNGEKLRVKAVNASIYHYGWVRPPQTQQVRQRSFHRLWHSDEWVEKNIGTGGEFDYSESGALTVFDGPHPSVMKDRVARQNWNFEYDPLKSRGPLKDRLLDWIGSKTGWRTGEYRNYRKV